MASVVGPTSVLQTVGMGIGGEFPFGPILELQQLRDVIPVEKVEWRIVVGGMYARTVSEQDRLQPLIPILLGTLVRKNRKAFVKEPVKPFR